MAAIEVDERRLKTIETAFSNANTQSHYDNTPMQYTAKKNKFPIGFTFFIFFWVGGGWGAFKKDQYKKNKFTSDFMQIRCNFPDISYRIYLFSRKLFACFVFFFFFCFFFCLV